jgi:MFS family permease
MYKGDWVLRLSQLVRDGETPAGWRLPANVWGLGITSLLTDISSEMVISVLPAYLVLTRGLTPLALGVVTGLHEGGPILATWAGGLIADRSGRRKPTAIFGYALSAACRLGWLALSGRTIAPIAGLVLADRVGKSIRTAPRDAMISLSVRAGQLATAFGVHRALDAAGAAVGPVLAFALLWRLPRRYDVIFFTSFVVAVLGVAALALLVDERAQPGPAGLPQADWTWAEALAVFTDAPLRRTLILATALSLVTISDAFIYLLIVQRSHASPHWLPLLYTGTAISFLTLAIPVGYIADRVGRRRTFVIGHAPLLGAYLVALPGFNWWPWNAVTAVVFLGAYYASSDGVLPGLAGGQLPVKGRAVGLAWVATAVSLARLCSSILFGLLWVRAGDLTAVFTFAAALIAVASAALRTRVTERPLTS